MVGSQQVVAMVSIQQVVAMVSSQQVVAMVGSQQVVAMVSSQQVGAIAQTLRSPYNHQVVSAHDPFLCRPRDPSSSPMMEDARRAPSPVTGRNDRDLL